MTSDLLTRSGFERLLEILDDDRDRAAVAYEQLRRRIAALLQWWGAPDGDDLADVTFDRVAQKLDEGAVIPRTKMAAYARSVARLTFYESVRRQRRQRLNERGAVGVWDSSPDVEDLHARLERCLATLPGADRHLVLRYYGDGRANDMRRELARQAGISGTALRIRAHRIRGRLETLMRES
jgi:DNA-directed RNA polymerase specialized sigma24 family protein